LPKESKAYLVIKQQETVKPYPWLPAQTVTKNMVLQIPEQGKNSMIPVSSWTLMRVLTQAIVSETDNSLFHPTNGRDVTLDIDLTTQSELHLLIVKDYKLTTSSSFAKITGCGNDMRLVEETTTASLLYIETMVDTLEAGSARLVTSLTDSMAGGIKAKC